MATPISKVTLTIDNREYILGLNQATQQTKTFGTEAAAAFNRADAASNKLNLSATNLTKVWWKPVILLKVKRC